MMGILQSARAMACWFDAVMGAAKAHPDGVFHKEFIEWMIAEGSEHEGRQLDTANVEQMDEFDAQTKISLDYMKAAKLITVDRQRPLRLYPERRMFTPHPELIFKATPKGIRLSNAIDQRKHFFFMCEIVKHGAAKAFAKAKVPLAVLSAAVSVLKFVFQWDTISAGIAAVATAALAAIAVSVGHQH